MEFPFLPQLIENFQASGPNSRYLIGICGPPASGKSWLSTRLSESIKHAIGENISTAFAMDAYHFYEKDLQEKGLTPFKGSPFTFDAPAFIDKLIEIKEKPGEIFCPIFDRSIDEPVQNALRILPEQRIVVVEGNYLLTRVFPWNTIKYLLDMTIFLDVNADIQQNRLIQRHMALGKSETEAHEKIKRTDAINTELIRKEKDRADIIFIPKANS
ncbi:MAG: nucleoside/nucleotide kinase family protein [Bacteroidia bacterium]|nr:nucleoside/nucleotide kinase family protein [Bacteroidia bacterium]